MIKIFIVDDHEIIRKSLVLILKVESDMEVVGVASNGTDFLKQIQSVACDIVLLDLNMPGLNGLEIIEKLKKLKPKIKTLVLSIQPEKKYALDALNAGASGYVNKSMAVSELVFAIRKILTTGRYLSPSFTELLAFGEIHSSLSPMKALTEVENSLLILLATGKNITEISNQLDLKENTILTYRHRLLKKLKLKTNIELTHYAFDNKLIGIGV